MNDVDRSQWIDNDEFLYMWWKGSKKSKYQFIKENKQEIDDYINRILHKGSE